MFWIPRTAHLEANIVVSLYRCAAAGRALIARTTTNADGRCDAPPLADAACSVGVYELDFAIGDYFAARGVVVPEPRFVDVVTMGFGEGKRRHGRHQAVSSPAGEN